MTAVRRWARIFVYVSGAAIALVSTVGQAEATPKEEAARAETSRGAAAYNLGHYDEAAQHYEEAYRLIQDPTLLFNIGQSYRLAGKTDKAIVAYRSYLRTAPDDAPARAQVERRVKELEQAALPAAAPVRTEVHPPSLASPPPPLTAAAPPTTALAFEPSPPTTDSPDSPIYKRWWFWGGIVALAAGTTAILLTGGHAASPTRGNTDPGVVTLR
jgi:tetratricopeptide (TPR) repeat protein